MQPRREIQQQKLTLMHSPDPSHPLCRCVPDLWASVSPMQDTCKRVINCLPTPDYRHSRTISESPAGSIYCRSILAVSGGAVFEGSGRIVGIGSAKILAASVHPREASSVLSPMRQLSPQTRVWQWIDRTVMEVMQLVL